MLEGPTRIIPLEILTIVSIYYTPKNSFAGPKIPGRSEIRHGDRNGNADSDLSDVDIALELASLRTALGQQSDAVAEENAAIQKFNRNIERCCLDNNKSRVKNLGLVNPVATSVKTVDPMK